MLSDHALIYFGPGPWEGMWRNRHQLMSRFARHNRVLYVQPPNYWRKSLSQVLEKDEHRLGHLKLAGGIQQISNGLYVYHSPLITPLAGRWPLDALTRWLWWQTFSWALRPMNFDNPIVWIARPEWQWIVGRLRERLTIYHVVDEYSAYQGLTPDTAEHIRQVEQQVLSRADLVVAVSPPLVESKRAHNPHTHLVANGVDAQAFSQTGAAPPADLAELPRPRILYAGLIGARLDLEMLATVARRRSNWSWVLLGEVNVAGVGHAMAQLQALANVHFLGVKPVNEVPTYLAACDVCVLPYRRDAEANYIDPLKLYEGLAAGKPVVATPIPAVQPFMDLIRHASTADELEWQISAATHDITVEAVARRRAAVATHTWDARVEQLSQIVHTRLTAGSGTNV